MIETDRLLLRRWQPDDVEPFAALNDDPAVMQYFPNRLDRAACAAMIERIEAHFERHGFGLWAVEVRDGAPLIGFVGLTTVDFEAPFAPAVEVGWRLAQEAWRRGYATEAAKRALAFGFDDLDLHEIVSFTVPANRRSRGVMERIGLTRDPADDFEHAKLPGGHALRHHVLYRIDQQTWRSREAIAPDSRPTSG